VSNKSKLVADMIDNIRRVFQAVNEYSKKAERETGLTSPQLWAIKVIAEGAPIKVSEVANRMYLHPATVVGILDRLEGRDLVTRTRSKEDRRVVEIDSYGAREGITHKVSGGCPGLLVKGLETLSKEKLLELDDGLKVACKNTGRAENPAQTASFA